MKILKIHFDPPSSKYGTGNFILNFSKQLSINDYDVTNLCCRRYEIESFEKSKIKLCSIKFNRRLPFVTFLFEFLILEFFSAYYLVKNHKMYNLVITYGEVGVISSIICKFLKKKHIKYFFVLYKDIFFLRKKEKDKYKKKESNIKKKIIFLLEYLEDRLRINLENFFLKFEKNFITGSRLTKKRIKNQKNKNILVNHYYHNLEIKEFNINKEKNKKNLLLIGNDIYLKGLLKFLYVIKKDYKFYLKNIKVYIIGVSNTFEFENYVNNLNLNEIINFYPHTNNVSHFYNDIDIFVNLSLIEGWNISIIDAYLRKIKIFSTKVGCINELFFQDENVKTCSKFNIDNINENLKKFILDNNKFNNEHYYKVIKKLNHNEITKNYINFFEKIKNEKKN